MLNSKAKRPNALKHGVFAKTAILRGEDPEEFQDLHSALVEEWNPIGPTEEDAKRQAGWISKNYQPQGSP